MALNPEIKRYLDEHGATYTREALRKGLLDAGYDPAEVDAALARWNAEQIVPGPDANNRRTFRRWAFGLHLGALVGMVVLLIALRGTDAIGTAGIAAAVLGVALVIGWAISSLIGRALLPRTGPTIALVVPAISAIALGGSCLALMVGSISPPSMKGSVHLTMSDPPFDATGSAACNRLDVGGVQLNSEEFGSLDGRHVSIFLAAYGNNPTGPAGPGDLSISVFPVSSTGPPDSYTAGPGTLNVDAAPDGLTGTVQFEGLVREQPKPASGDALPNEISGTITWTCT
jgi:hypothetical protein